MTNFLHSPIVAVAVSILAAAYAFDYAFASNNADLIASWVAGTFLDAGLADHVYTGSAEAFTLHPHPAWPAHLEGLGYRGPVFPFVYPPLWAWAMGHIGSIEGFRLFTVAVLSANAAMLAGTLWLAMRISRSGMPPVAYVGLGALLLLGTTVGAVPLVLGQPHILVSFLLVLAIALSRDGQQTFAGAALALAAALKLYPALFALIWLVGGERRAVASFAVVGAGLAATSVAVAGWNLHLLFLGELSAISRTVLVTGMSPNLQSVVAQLFFADHLFRVTPIEVNRMPPPDAAWHYLAIPPQITWLSNALVALVVAGVLWLSVRTGPEDRAAVVWPLAMTATALVLPLSWSYYFIPAVAFLPGIAWRFGRVWGTLTVAAMALPSALGALGASREIETLTVSVPFVVLCGALLILGVGAARRHTQCSGAPGTAGAGRVRPVSSA